MLGTLCVGGNTIRKRCAKMDDVSRLRGIRQKVTSLRISELKVVLQEINLARSGRKSELVDRIVDALVVRVFGFSFA